MDNLLIIINIKLWIEMFSQFQILEQNRNILLPSAIIISKHTTDIATRDGSTVRPKFEQKILQKFIVS